MKTLARAETGAPPELQSWTELAQFATAHTATREAEAASGRTMLVSKQALFASKLMGSHRLLWPLHQLKTQGKRWAMISAHFNRYKVLGQR
jgi:hypothetical protein